MLIIYKNIFLPFLFFIFQFNLFLIYCPNAQAKKVKESLAIINEHKTNEVLVEESNASSVRRQRDLKVPEEKENKENNECTIRVNKVIEYPGKCVRINGGTACKNDRFLDPYNNEC
ncbi:unnamed protein product [Meloidogyne enterolobii]|uniref:Uncharacterized protein n=1 Tax=Meloidogyne enterolobii TaxID=390850 RepID=A0ACB0ZQV2_MELEN